MASKQFNNTLKRSALTVALGLCFAGSVQAQSSVGSIFGDTQAGATVRVENIDTGASREITADSSGRFALPQLSPGRYRVTSGGVTREVRVSVGTGTSVSLAAPAAGGELDTVTVVGAGAINPIDVSSVESTTVFTAEQIQALPVSRDVTNVALLAPGTVRGDTGLGNLASFGGASVAENGYYINGFDVTNLRSLLSYANLPFESVAEQQVKTGGYGAEYGRSLGGVINLVTKRGTNEWKFGGSVYWEPNQLRSTGKDVLGNDQSGDQTPAVRYVSADEQDTLEFNAYGGGPLIKDKLFMFGLVTGRKNTLDTFDQSSSEYESNTSPQGLLKLDWNITDDHLLEFTGIYNKETLDRDHYDNINEFSRNHDLFAYDYEVKSGGRVLIGKYTGYLTDSLTLSAQYGDLKYDNPYIPGGLPGEDCPTVYGVGLVYLGCWPAASFASVRPATAGPDVDRRKAWRIDLDWRIGDHAIRGGIDSEEFTSTFEASTYAGGVYYRYFPAPAPGGTTNGVPNDQPYVRERHLIRSSGSYVTTNEAAYLEDSWSITDNFVLYGGVRLERFDNENADGVSFVKSDDLWAPRVGFSWDVNGDSSFKVFGNAGRYFIPVANNTSIRASGAEATTNQYFLYTAVDPTTGAPTKGTELGTLQLNGGLNAPNPATVAAANLSPMYQDEYILGMQKQLTDNLTIGIRGIRRSIKDGFDDTCAHQPLIDWATDNGYTNFDYSTAAQCYLINPGRDADLALDLQNDGNFTVVHIPSTYFGLPQYRRDYQAVEFFFERMKADNWALQGSYTYAKSKGNAEGYVNSTLEQADAGITQDFDFAAFGDGAYGYLPNDRRHTVKLFGTYSITDDWRVGANLLVQSGRPVNCNGYIPETHPSFQSIDAGSINAYSASSFYCHDAAGNPHLGNRGDHGRTPWTHTIDANVAWTPQFGDGQLTLQMDVFNLLGNESVTEFVETGDKNRSFPVANPNYLQPANFNAPRYVRLSARYDF